MGDVQDHDCEDCGSVADFTLALGSVCKVFTSLGGIDSSIRPYLHCTECREPEDGERHIERCSGVDVYELLSSLPQWDDG